MADEVRLVEGGTVTTPKGYLAGATYAGLKTYAVDKLDLGILMSRRACTAAGVFTTNKLKSPSVTVTQEHLAHGKVRALVVDAGIANACVGDQGYIDAKEVTKRAAKHLGLLPEEILFCSTGLIGVELPMSLINRGISRIELGDDGGHALARAMMTTDTHPKEIAVVLEANGNTVTIGGVTKGAAMIHPNMATMLCFITTDAEIPADLLQKMLKSAVDDSFNMITVDGDTSTNDTVLVFANGAAGAGPIREGSEASRRFEEGLRAVCTHLAKEIVGDAEGGTKLIEIVIEGARNTKEARMAARTIALSTLVKTAVHGNDPNWGRVVAALGRSGADVDEKKIALYINDVCIMEDGKPIPFHKDAVVAIMSGPSVSFRLRLNLGSGQATAWGCNLSEEYVTLNSAYTT